MLRRPKPGQYVTLEHPNGDRIGPRRVSLERGPGGSMWLNVERVGDVSPQSAQSRFSRPLEQLLDAGWRLTAILDSPGEVRPTLQQEAMRERVKLAILTARDGDGDPLYAIPPGAAGMYADAVMRALLEQDYPPAPEAELRCPTCGGLEGSHGFVHVRHGNGGGHNRPCPEPDVSSRGADRG